MGFLSKLLGGRSAVQEIDVATTKEAIARGDAQLVDCRTEREWRSGHIEGSQLVPLGSIGSRMHEIDPERPVIVVCKSGHRSGIVARQLASAGFADASSMKGGLNAWTRSGNPLVT